MSEQSKIEAQAARISWLTDRLQDRTEALSRVTAERDAAQEHVAYHLSDYSLNSGLTGDLAVDMAAYARRLKVRADAAEAALSRVRALMAHLHTDLIYVGDLRAVLENATPEPPPQAEVLFP